MSKIDISEYDRADVLRVLYDNSKPQGLGFLHYDPKPMTYEESENYLLKQDYFDYLKGRVMKVNLSTNELDTRLYDRDNGEGAALRAIQTLN